MFVVKLCSFTTPHLPPRRLSSMLASSEYHRCASESRGAAVLASREALKTTIVFNVSGRGELEQLFNFPGCLERQLPPSHLPSHFPARRDRSGGLISAGNCFGTQVYGYIENGILCLKDELQNIIENQFLCLCVLAFFGGG